MAFAFYPYPFNAQILLSYKTKTSSETLEAVSTNINYTTENSNLLYLILLQINSHQKILNLLIETIVWAFKAHYCREFLTPAMFFFKL